MNIAIFASHGGSNFENICRFERENGSDCKFKVKLLISNNPEAFVLKRAEKLSVPSLVISPRQFLNDQEYVSQLMKLLNKYNIQMIVLAGYMKLLPMTILQHFPKRVINIHPSLLPKFGGKGMYGDHVFRAVFESREEYSGITIHYVSEHYDEGEILVQERFKIESGDTLDTIKTKTQELEKNFYPVVIQKICSS